MKIYISADMEGMAGITHPSEEREDTVRFRQALHNQIEWMIAGIHASHCNDRIEEITIADSHGGGSHLSYALLSAMDERITLISGSPRLCYMMSGLDSTYDMVFLAGYHAGAGTACAGMDHCFYGRAVHEIRINGVWMNEATANAALAGEYQVPVALVAGDSALERQLIEEGRMPWVRYITTKEPLSRTASCYKPQAKLRTETIAAVAEVLERGAAVFPLYEVKTPCRLAMTFNYSSMAEGVSQLPCVERTDARTVSVACETMAQAESAILALATLASCYS